MALKVIRSGSTEEKYAEELSKEERQFVIIDEIGVPDSDKIDLGDIVTDPEVNKIHLVTRDENMHSSVSALRCALVMLRGYLKSSDIDVIVVSSQLFYKGYTPNAIVCLMKELFFECDINIIVCIPAGSATKHPQNDNRQRREPVPFDLRSAKKTNDDDDDDDDKDSKKKDKKKKKKDKDKKKKKKAKY